MNLFERWLTLWVALCIAVGIALLERWASTDEPPGGLLLVASPDEEQTSEGMRAIAGQLAALTQQWEIAPIAAINVDASHDPGDGRDGQAIFLGSVGKLLASAFVVGRETHAGAPFAGVNAAFLGAAVTQALECNPALSDEVAGEVSPPPVCLSQRDLKDYYDVTTPTQHWSVYNILSYQRSSAAALNDFRIVVQQALDGAINTLAARAAAYTSRSGMSSGFADWRAHVLSFAELHTIALERGGQAAHHALEALHAALQNDPTLDLPAYSLAMTRLAWQWSGLSGPAAVVGVAGVVYRGVALDPAAPTHQRLREVAEREAARLMHETGVALCIRPMYPGISDMSFLGSRESQAELALLTENTPTWERRWRYDAAALQTLNLPMLNIGPWGRDYHQRNERLFMPYAFATLPELLWRIATRLLQAPSLTS